MKNFLTFEEFVNESYLVSEGDIWFGSKGSFSKDKLKDGESVSVYTNDTLISGVSITSSGKSLGIKVNWVSTERDRSQPRYIAAKILNGPNKGTILFCETVFEPRKQDSWYSLTPGKYKFKTEEVETGTIPSKLQSIYDELISFI